MNFLRSGKIFACLSVALFAVGCSGSENENVEKPPIPEDLVSEIVMYTDMGGKQLPRYAWRGKKMILLSESGSLNRTTMKTWVDGLDAAYEYYTKCTGREPDRFSTIEGLSTLADVPSTCGAGCGWLGGTGVEFQHDYFVGAYNELLTKGKFYDLNFYELGRNFWFYGGKISMGNGDPTCTGYAIFMRTAIPENIGLDAEDDTDAIIRGQFDTYMKNGYTFENTIHVNQGVDWGATDLFASFCLKLYDTYGKEFLENVWKFVGNRPDAANESEAVSNFIIACSQAVRKNLCDTFEHWRWPVSDETRFVVNSFGFESAGIIE